MKSRFSLLSGLIILLICVSTHGIHAQKNKRKQKKQTEEVADEKSEPKEKDKSKKKIKPFDEVITKDALSDEGLFNVHKVDDKWYFEIPFELLNEELLIVTRISGYVKNLSFGGAGMKSRPQQVIRWQRHDNNVLLRSVSYNSTASHEEPIYLSVRNNNFEPIIKQFPIKAFDPDSTAVVIEVNELFTNDVPMIGAMNEGQRKRFEIGGLDTKRSLVNGISSFPENVEVRHVLTYKGKKLPDNALTQTLSVELNQSIIKLPDEVMQPRYYDSRVGYFSLERTNYSLDEQRAAKQRFITRWRLEPKNEAAYYSGQLVEPSKPIVYYIDPATPKKWRPYLKQGVEDWQPAFEAAGFKNAIIAKDPPDDDPDWSPEDVRYSVIRYISTDIQNAMGPHVHDPRSGEILESDILWYHNVMNLLRNWFFIQTAAVNPEARSVKFQDEMMGELIRFVAAHEVGHTLGLPHNWGSSVGYPVDSLRSPHFTNLHGTAPSIMDYARFNYIAQPEDGVTNFYPKLGEYDMHSIAFGYKCYQDKDEEEERIMINDWLKSKAGDPLYRYGAQQRAPHDPTAQREDLGDDAIYASKMGIANLKRIVPNLISWTTEDTKEFEDLQELYQNVFSQLGRYMTHVTNQIGGVYEFRKTAGENDVVFTHTPKSIQQDAVQFLNEQLFSTPDWLLDEAILRRIEKVGATERLRAFQTRFLDLAFDKDRLLRLAENEALNGADAYAALNLFEDVRLGIWTELSQGSDISTYRRNLQRSFLSTMDDLLKLEDEKYDVADMKSLARGTLKRIRQSIKTNARKIGDEASRYHLDDCTDRIENILHPLVK